MKKILGAAVLMAAGAAWAVTTIESSNTFGFVPVTAGGLTAVSVPVAGYTAGTDIVIAEVLQTANLTAGDKLYTMTGEGKYNEYVLQGDKTWQSSRVVTVVGGKITSASGTPATTAKVQRGQAFWIQTSADQVNLMGEATADAGSLPTLSSGWQMIGSPSMTESLKISTISGSAGDFLNVKGVLYQYSASKKWVNRATRAAVTDTDVIPVGVGAMLRHQ